MSSKASIINSPLLSFEITQQGSSGLYVKYLMAAFFSYFCFKYVNSIYKLFYEKFLIKL